MSIPMKFAETKNELVKSLRKSAKDNLRMADLRTPIAMTLGERYALIAEIEKNIADRIDAMWKREQKRKPRRNCDVGTLKEQSQRFDAFCDAHKYVGDDGANWCSRTCPCYNQINCGVQWAQMPYEEGGAE